MDIVRRNSIIKIYRIIYLLIIAITNPYRTIRDQLANIKLIGFLMNRQLILFVIASIMIIFILFPMLIFKPSCKKNKKYHWSNYTIY